jgi:organic radical activating enzyme
MAKTASQDALADLHALIAKTFTDLVGDPDLCNAAILGAATKFLKDNNITAVVEDNKALSEMEKKIQEMQARRKQRASNVVPLVPTPEVTDAEAEAAVEQAYQMATPKYGP